MNERTNERTNERVSGVVRECVLGAASGERQRPTPVFLFVAAKTSPNVPEPRRPPLAYVSSIFGMYKYRFRSSSDRIVRQLFRFVCGVLLLAALLLSGPTTTPTTTTTPTSRSNFNNHSNTTDKHHVLLPTLPTLPALPVVSSRPWPSWPRSAWRPSWQP